MATATLSLVVPDDKVAVITSFYYQTQPLAYTTAGGLNNAQDYVSLSIFIDDIILFGYQNLKLGMMPDVQQTNILVGPGSTLDFVVTVTAAYSTLREVTVHSVLSGHFLLSRNIALNFERGNIK